MAHVLSSLVTPRHTLRNDFKILTINLILNMYNTAFIAHNILRTASQEMGLHRCIEMSYLTLFYFEAVWNLFYIKTDV
jgi:hypothetical protein